MLAINRSFLELADRDRDIVQRRMGWSGSPQTLQEIADQYGLTRERIRQIENRAVQKLRRSQWERILTRKVDELLSEREYPLPVIGVEAVDKWFEGVSDHLHAFRFVFASIYQGNAKLVRIDGIDYFASFTEQQWEAIVREARRLLQAGAEKAWTMQHCHVVVSSLLPTGSRAFEAMLWDKAAALCHFARSVGGEDLLTSYGRGVEQIVEAVLSESDEPLHYSVIANLAADRSGNSVDVRRVHNAAAAVGYLMAPGTYGLDRHLPPAAILGEIAELSEELVLNGPAARQWHASEILASLMELNEALIEERKVSKYVVDIALQKAGGLKRLGRMVWTAQSATDEVARIDVREAIISVLVEAGRPLRSEEVRQQLIALRGVGEHFQIMVADPIIRVGEGVWGLNDRDVAIKRKDQPRLIDGLVSILTARGDGIHVLELRKANLFQVSGITEQTLCSLACSDERLSIGNGYLYLKDWGSPRRESLSEAVRSVLNEARMPLSTGEITNLAEARLRRAVERSSILSSLRAVEARFDPASDRWSLPEPVGDDEDDLALSA